MSTNETKDTNTLDQQGHRGCRGLMPENTIPAMLHALKLGVTTLEMDIVFTKDSIAILSHEPFFNHEITTKPDGGFITESTERQFNIYQLTFAETQQFDVGQKQHPRFPQQQKMTVHKPSLAAVFDSVIDYVARYNMPFPHFNIETKTNPLTDGIFHPAPTEFTEWLVKLIHDKKMLQWVMIQSFDIRTLQYLHKNYPNIPTVLLVEDYDKRSYEQQTTALGFTPAVYSPHYTSVNSNLIRLVHQQKVKIIPWTVNDLETIQKLTKAGVDGIITDYPNLFNQ